MNPIETAVAPLKTEAIERAAVEASKVIDRLVADLEANEWDMNEIAPFPRSLNESRNSYLEKKRKYDMVSFLTKSYINSSSFNGPKPVYMNEENIERFIELAKENAASQYDAFVSKLNFKIGECDSAELEGNHVWGYSFLTVKKGEDTEIWKTQMIVNVSKLGKLFNQFPTRKVKRKV